MYRTTLAIFTVLIARSLAQSSTTSLPPWQTGIITEDGTCGKGTPEWVCSPSWGACCGKDSKCGRSSAFCGEGCQVGYGNCNAVQPPAPVPGSTSPDGSCGGTKQYNCTGSTFGDCCSSSGFCGTTAGYCGPGCQTLFGTCVDQGDTSTDGRCGSAGGGKKCVGSGFGDCCSSTSFCGSTTDHCGAGCQAGYGTCTGGSGGGNISTDGSCGSNGKTCQGSTFGDCCSSSGFCGNGTAFCGSGCQSGFGTCTGGSGGNVSTDGQCGSNGKTCKGSTFGDCCSSSGFCGSGSAFCGPGCQANAGTCEGAGNVSTDGKCGSNGKTCKGSTFGDCCSSSGFCGSGSAFCGPGCQPNAGTCEGAGNVSTDGKCGSNGKTCKGSTFGDCCSSSGFCGTGSAFCGSGCQPNAGTCEGSGNVSTDGQCGKNGKTCKGSTFGDCCSSSGFCGKTDGYCGAGCQPSFGTCGSVSNISTDGQCGSNGKTCKGSTFGDCCSSSGFCGRTDTHCSAGCQPSFGTCGTGSNISIDGKCGANGKTCKGSTYGDCCSSAGFCGKSDTHCLAGCQPNFGTCGSGSGGISTDGKCGANGKTCAGSTFGNCCSSTSFCGKEAGHCGQGCQKTYSSACLTTNIPSNDGSCGSSKGGFTCAGGPFNNQCCSSAGFCGTTSTHCGSGCQKGYGRCN